MIDTAGTDARRSLQIIFLIPAIVFQLSATAVAQVYDPVFKAVEMQATIAPLGDLAVGNFFGHVSVAAVSKSEKAIYFFVPDSLENLILTNVVSLPDTPVSLVSGNEISLESSPRSAAYTKLAVMMKSNKACLISFTRDGEPVVSDVVALDSSCTGIRVADLQASGRLDIISFGRFSLGISVYKNLGGGRFADPQRVKGSVATVPFNDIAFADFNGDLVPDIASLDWVNRRLLIFYGRGDGTFAQPVAFPLTAEPSVLTVADLNGNGYPDIVLGYTRQNRIDIYSGDGFGRFFLKQSLKTCGPVSKFALADFSGDGSTDIAAYSDESNSLTVFTYDPESRIFRYGGAIGIGSQYHDIVPLYFDNRFRADVVTSSPTEKFLKVLKTAVAFYKSPDILVPVPSGSNFLAVCGNDTSNFIVAVDSSGSLTARYYDGSGSMDVVAARDLPLRGIPDHVQIVSANPLSILVSYRDNNSLSFIRITNDSVLAGESVAMTQFHPIAIRGEFAGDSAVIAAASVSSTDSTIGVSVFGSTKSGGAEFLERDFAVKGKPAFFTAGLSLEPSYNFVRLEDYRADTVIIRVSNLISAREYSDTIAAAECMLVSRTSARLPLIAAAIQDSVSLFEVAPDGDANIELRKILGDVSDRINIRKIAVSEIGQTRLIASTSVDGRSVTLYESRGGNYRSLKSWHVTYEPQAIAILPAMNRICFLNQNESYASIHSY